MLSVYPGERKEKNFKIADITRAAKPKKLKYWVFLRKRARVVLVMTLRMGRVFISPSVLASDR
jgi:hypothetical protein